MKTSTIFFLADPRSRHGTRISAAAAVGRWIAAGSATALLSVGVTPSQAATD